MEKNVFFAAQVITRTVASFRSFLRHEAIQNSIALTSITVNSQKGREDKGFSKMY